ncbi:MAG: hypothetical protein L6R19_25545 [Alphaproteobacteria bacterium]|nr:hypothetical protein [Alphaproteobacteria bacterium]
MSGVPSLLESIAPFMPGTMSGVPSPSTSIAVTGPALAGAGPITTTSTVRVLPATGTSSMTPSARMISSTRPSPSKSTAMKSPMRV